MHRLTGAAQAVREQLSTDTWFVLGRLEGVLQELASDATDISGALSRVLEGLLALAGLAAESHVRDAGWCLLDAGRRVERAQHVTALLAATLCEPPAPAAADDLVVESVLITAESIITHRRRHRSGIDAVLELLLVDRANPRAVGHQLERLRADAAAIPGPDGGVDTALAGLDLRLAAADPVALARRGPDGTRDDLRSLLTGLNHDLLWFAEVLERGRFAPGLPPRPLGPVVV